MTCEDCVFQEGGVCKRYPRQVLVTGDGGIINLYPKANDWCGEFRPRGTQKQSTTDVSDSPTFIPWSKRL